MNVKNRMILLVVGLAMAWLLCVSAQDKPTDNMALVVEKIRAHKKLFIAIAQNMQLIEAEAKALGPRRENNPGPPATASHLHRCDTSQGATVACHPPLSEDLSLTCSAPI
ncbi:MAG: hypothetical protein SWQ30_14695 [Thermodesulfobacteriota bacterium]|nr:hypothetical protein [Thermodesulfobacteriota bacterium]